MQIPHHKSLTCVVHMAIDHESINGDERVAMKFMNHQDQFEREVTVRSTVKFDPKFVIGIIDSYSTENDINFRTNLDRYGLQNFPFCIVMPAGKIKIDCDSKYYYCLKGKEVWRLFY